MSTKALCCGSAMIVVVAVAMLTASAIAVQPPQTRPANQTKVVLLGTGTPQPSPDRSGPATAIVVNDTAYLVDFGPGVVRRASAAATTRGITALEPVNLRVAFVTHLHSDHTVGYADLIFTPWTVGRRVPLEVYGPKGLKAMTEHLLEAYRVDIETRTNPDGNQRTFPDGHKVNAHEISSRRRLQGRERHRHRLCDEARDGKLRLSVRHAGSQHRHLRRHEPDAGDDRRVPRVRRADSRGPHAGVARGQARGRRCAAGDVPALLRQVPHHDAGAGRSGAAGQAATAHPLSLLEPCHPKSCRAT